MENELLYYGRMEAKGLVKVHLPKPPHRVGNDSSVGYAFPARGRRKRFPPPAANQTQCAEYRARGLPCRGQRSSRLGNLLAHEVVAKRARGWARQKAAEGRGSSQLNGRSGYHSSSRPPTPMHLITQTPYLQAHREGGVGVSLAQLNTSSTVGVARITLSARVCDCRTAALTRSRSRSSHIL